MTHAKQTAMALYGFHEWPATHIRHKAAADCRTYACLLLRDEGYSLNQTAKELGYADHTAVIWAIRRYDDGKLDGHAIKVFKEKNMRDENAPETIECQPWAISNGVADWSGGSFGLGFKDMPVVTYIHTDILDKRIAEALEEVADRLSKKSVSGYNAAVLIRALKEEENP